jgi:hypothetical protein
MKLVKTIGFTVAVAAAITIMPSRATAESYDSDDSSHPFRIIAYPLHAIGVGLEYGFGRPIHEYVSQPKNRYIWGKVSNPRTDDYRGDYDLYQRYSY